MVDYQNFIGGLLNHEGTTKNFKPTGRSCDINNLHFGLA